MTNLIIMLTCPCNVYPLTPHFYIVKLGFTGWGIHFFLFFALKHRSWVHVRTASVLTEAVLTCTHDLCLSKNKKNIAIFHLKIIIFTAVKNCCILHGHVFVMDRLSRAQAHSVHWYMYFPPCSIGACKPRHHISGNMISRVHLLVLFIFYSI